MLTTRHEDMSDDFDESNPGEGASDWGGVY